MKFWILCLLLVSCRPVGASRVAETVEVAHHAPSALFHFGEYRHFKDYADYVGPPSDSAWAAIPSNGDSYKADRRGLYGSQHPAYNERYAAAQLGKPLDFGPWLVRILTESRCAGPAGRGVVKDNLWPNSGFWIIRDRSCIRDIEARPEHVLEMFASVKELWNRAPFTTGKSRFEDDGEAATKVLFAILMRALAMVEETRANLFSDMRTIAQQSDLPDVRALVVKTIDVAEYCHATLAWHGLRTKWTKLLDGGLVDFARFGKGELQQSCPGADQEPLAIPLPDPDVLRLNELYKKQKSVCTAHTEKESCEGQRECLWTVAAIEGVEPQFVCTPRAAPCSDFNFSLRSCFDAERACLWYGKERDSYGTPLRFECIDLKRGCFQFDGDPAACGVHQDCEFAVRERDTSGSPIKFACIKKGGACSQYRDDPVACARAESCVYAVTSRSNLGEPMDQLCLEAKGPCEQFAEDRVACLRAERRCKHQLNTEGAYECTDL